jgi:hypothetical protein
MLDFLPNDVSIHMFKFMNMNDINNTQKTCKRINKIKIPKVVENKIYKNMFINLYKIGYIMKMKEFANQDCDYKEIYSRSFIKYGMYEIYYHIAKDCIDLIYEKKMCFETTFYSELYMIIFTIMFYNDSYGKRYSFDLYELHEQKIENYSNDEYANQHKFIRMLFSRYDNLIAERRQ